jgi:hypothetical protein
VSHRRPGERKEDPTFLTTGGVYVDDLDGVPELAGAVPDDTVAKDAAGHAEPRFGAVGIVAAL